MPIPAPRLHTSRVTEVTYPNHPEQIGLVRAGLRALLHGCPVAEDVLLGASELATNAILHSSSRRPGGTFTVHSQVSPGNYVRIEVEDDGGAWNPNTDGPERGRGLDIVHNLADDWGVSGDRDGRTVWALFDWNPGQLAR